MQNHHLAGKMLNVRLNMDCAPGGMELMTPSSSMTWGNCIFSLNPPTGGRADFCIVLWNARPVDRFACAPENTLLIIGEPTGKIYAPQFYQQFGHVVDTHSVSAHPHLILNAPGLNWHVGLDMSTGTYRYGYDFLSSLAFPKKENKIAVVCSNAASTPGHRRRLALLEHLKQHLGDQLVHFGRGFQPIDDKMEAILPYRYQLVLENSQSPHYWTEKIADAWLGWGFPVYLGCPNIGDFFPTESFHQLDGDDFDGATAAIKNLLALPEDAEQVAAVARARDLVLNKYNPFAWSAHWAETLYRQAPDEDLTIRIHKAFRPFPRGHIYRMRHFMRGKG